MIFEPTEQNITLAVLGNLRICPRCSKPCKSLEGRIRWYCLDCWAKLRELDEKTGETMDEWRTWKRLTTEWYAVWANIDRGKK